MRPWLPGGKWVAHTGDRCASIGGRNSSDDGEVTAQWHPAHEALLSNRSLCKLQNEGRSYPRYQLLAVGEARVYQAQFAKLFHAADGAEKHPQIERQEHWDDFTLTSATDTEAASLLLGDRNRTRNESVGRRIARDEMGGFVGPTVGPCAVG